MARVNIINYCKLLGTWRRFDTKGGYRKSLILCISEEATSKERVSIGSNYYISKNYYYFITKLKVVLIYLFTHMY